MPRRPVNAPYTVTTNHGEYVGKNAKFLYHSGYDYAVPLDRQVYAPIKGKVTFAGWSTTGGNMIVIFDGVFWHRLMHMNSLQVITGQHINEGDHIGKAGTTGLSTGVHVHWDIIKVEVAQSFSDYLDNDPWLKGEYNHLYTSELLPYQRKVGANGVNERTSPNTTGGIYTEWKAGEVLDFKGYVKGESYNGNDIWFVGRYNGRFFWSGAFTDSSTTGLSDLTAPAPTPQPIPTPVPVPEPTPTPTPYQFTKDLPSVTEVIPAGLGSFEYGNFPESPTGIVLHDFGTAGINTYESVINYFKKTDNIASHFVISGKRKTQMVALKDRAYHAGAKGNHLIGIEIDPVQDADTVASTRQVINELEVFYGKTLTLHKHPEFMPTSCGDDFDLATYRPQETPPATDLESRVTIIEDKLNKIKGAL